MRVLLDSHTVLWAIYEPERLPAEIIALIADAENELVVSLASVWELVNKAAAHRLPMVGSSVERMVERIEELEVIFLPITRGDILAAADLPSHHADPFDRILIAQAREHGLLLLTKDVAIARYDVQTLWQ